MIGIIYKNTILAYVKIDGHKPFYVGQHWGETLGDYYGSGVIWNKCLQKCKNKFPKNWRKIVKREILFIGNVTQKTLNVLEKIYIKNNKALYSEKCGGCNVLEGGDNNCPSKNDVIREKIRLSHLGNKNPTHKHVFTDEEKQRARERRMGVKMSEESRKKLSNSRRGVVFTEEHRKNISKAVSGKNHPNFGKRGAETSMFGKHQTEYQKKVMRERMSGKNNPMFGKPSHNLGKPMSEEQKIKISNALKGRKVDESKILRGDKHPMFGKKRSLEARLKTSKKLKGRKFTEEHKEKIRIATLKRYGKL